MKVFATIVGLASLVAACSSAGAEAGAGSGGAGLASSASVATDGVTSTGSSRDTTSASASTSTSSSSGAGGGGSIGVIVEPSDMAGALLAAIQSAKTSVHMTMYLMNDPRFIDALKQAKTGGLDVKVVLQNDPGNQTAFDQLGAAGVPIVWAPATFQLTHEKCVILDGAVAWIMTMNLQKTSSDNREFLGIDQQPSDVQEAEAVFEADFAGAAVSPNGPLLVAPVDARDKMLVALQGAKKTIDLEGEELSDYKIVDALAAAKGAGVAVRVVLADAAPSAAQQKAVSQLDAAGVEVVSVKSPYIHAKAFVADGTEAYIGSENFTTGSLQYNRELGLITTDAAVVAKVASTISGDIANGSPL